MSQRASQVRALDNQCIDFEAEVETGGLDFARFNVMRVARNAIDARRPFFLPSVAAGIDLLK